MSAFQKFRDELRAAGCSLVCCDQTKSAGPQGFTMEVWRVITPLGKLTHFVARVYGDNSGYALFIERAGNDIAGDVAAIMGDEMP